MRKCLALFYFAVASLSLYSQNIGIGTNNPDASAVLEISSANKGLLIPRMDSVNRKSIAATNGLMVYDTSTKCSWYYDGNRWVNVPPKGNAVGDLLYWNGAAWTVLPAGQGGQYLSLAPGTLVPAWSTVNTGGNASGISTQNISNIAATTAVSGGSITTDNGATITARGIVWSTSPNPTIVLSTKTNDGTGIGNFVSNMINLTPATTYYVRSYYTNANGTTYGNQVSFATVSNFTIGQTYGGGKIFYIDGTGQHGLIVANEDLSNGIAWTNTSIQATGATGVGIGTGQANTNTIIAVQGTGSYAASLCKLYYNGGGYSDWYLPSLYELNQLYLQRNLVGLPSQNVFWSSSEDSDFNAWTIDMSAPGPNQYASYKSNTFSVRAIRKF